MSEYAVSFRILAAGDWVGRFSASGDFSKRAFRGTKDELAVREDCTSLNSLIDLAICLDNRLRERVREWQEMWSRLRTLGPQLRSVESAPLPPDITRRPSNPRTPPANEPTPNWAELASLQQKDSAGCEIDFAYTVAVDITLSPSAWTCQKTRLINRREDFGEPCFFLLRFLDTGIWGNPWG